MTIDDIEAMVRRRYAAGETWARHYQGNSMHTIEAIASGQLASDGTNACRIMWMLDGRRASRAAVVEAWPAGTMRITTGT